MFVGLYRVLVNQLSYYKHLKYISDFIFTQNADNNARLDESQNCPAEGYSSIDRRRRIEVGQMVSYKASRVSRSSKANESGYGLGILVP